MKAGSQPTTSQINVGQFEDVFREYVKVVTPLLYVVLLPCYLEPIKVLLWFGT